MKNRVWIVSVYIYMAAIVLLGLIAMGAIWGYIGKEAVWRAAASAGVLSLMLLAVASALHGLKK